MRRGVEGVVETEKCREERERGRKRDGDRDGE